VTKYVAAGTCNLAVQKTVGESIHQFFYSINLNSTGHLCFEEDNVNNKNTIATSVVEKQEKRNDFGKTGTTRPFHIQSRFFYRYVQLLRQLKYRIKKRGGRTVSTNF
jgi:hypothetical protein